MSSRALAVLALFVASISAALISGRALFFHLAYLWGGLLGVAFVWSKLSLRGISFTREARSLRAQVGHIFDERFHIRNRSRLPKFWLGVDDQTEMPGYRATSLTGLGLLGPSDLVGHRGSYLMGSLAPGEEYTWLTRTVCTQRGRFALGPTALHGGDPFGLFPRTKSFASRRHVVVLPAVIPIRQFALPMGRLPGGEALRQRTHQVTPNAAGVRDYQPGDSLNRIHWRSTARRDRLIVKEFELDPLADVWILVDAQRQAQHGVSASPMGDGMPRLGRDPSTELPQSTEEFAVTIAASLGFHFLQQDRDVGLLAYGRVRHAIQPGRGHAQLKRLLESLAVLQAQGELQLAEWVKLEAPRIPRGASVILITASASPAVLEVARELENLGIGLVLILLDAVSFSGPVGSRRLAEMAERGGHPVRLIAYGDRLDEKLSQPTRSPQARAALAGG